MTMTYLRYGQGSSDNAYLAVREGRFPMSKITRGRCTEFGIPEEWPMPLIKLVLKRRHTGEYHHTSKEGHLTYFFDLVDLSRRISEGYENLQEALSEFQLDLKPTPKPEREQYRVVGAYVYWYGSTNHRNWKVYSGLGRRDGPWIIFDDGTRKKVNSNWICWERKEKPGRVSRAVIERLVRKVKPGYR